jgi:ABC-type uncharacterized transport system permease subunit
MTNATKGRVSGLVAFASVICFIAGVAQWSLPAAFVTAGLFGIVYALLLAYVVATVDGEERGRSD